MSGFLPLILASASPRRAELLAAAGVAFDVAVSGADETIPPGCDPAEGARLVALVKAREVAALYPDRPVLGADTVVALDGRVFGKPADGAEAVAMLSELSGRVHEVFTGVGLIVNGVESSFVTGTKVCFSTLGEGEISRYVATGEPLDKAGAYGIQGGAAAFVKWLHGSYTNVVGLPLAQTLKLLREAGVS